MKGTVNERSGIWLLLVCVDSVECVDSAVIVLYMLYYGFCLCVGPFGEVQG